MAAAQTPDPRQLVESFFAERERRTLEGAAMREGVGAGIAGVLRKTAGGLARQVAGQYYPDVLYGDEAMRFAERLLAESPAAGQRIVTGRPERASDIYPPPPSLGRATAEELAALLPPVQAVQGAQRLIEASAPRYLGQEISGPLLPGQARPIAVTPLGMLPPRTRGYEMGAGGTEAALGTAFTGLGLRGALEATRPEPPLLEATPVPEIAGLLPERGSPAPLPPERGLPGPIPGGQPRLTSFGGRPTEGPPGGGFGGAAPPKGFNGGSFKFTIRLPRDRYIEFSADGADEADALARVRAKLPPEQRAFFDRQPDIEVIRAGDARGIDGIYDIGSNHPNFRGRPGGAAAPEEPSAFEQARRRYARRGGGRPEPGKRPGAAERPSAGQRAGAGPKARAEKPPGGQTGQRTTGPEAAGAARSQRAERPAGPGAAQPSQESGPPPPETPIERMARQDRARAEKEFEDLHGYKAPSYLQTSDLKAINEQMRAQKAKAAEQPAKPETSERRGTSSREAVAAPKAAGAEQGRPRPARQPAPPPTKPGPVEQPLRRPSLQGRPAPTAAEAAGPTQAEQRLAKQTAVPAGEIDAKAARAALKRDAVYHGMDAKPLNDWHAKLFGQPYRKAGRTYSEAHDAVIEELKRRAAPERPAKARVEKPAKPTQPEVLEHGMQPEPAGLERVMRQTETARKAKAEPEKFSVEVPGLGVKMKTGGGEETPRREAAAEPSAGGRGGLRVPSGAAAGKAIKVRTPNRNYAAQYEEVPLASLKPSHDPETFAENPGYPFKQQRDYRTSKGEQLKVIEMARELDLDYLTSDDPTATTGPPVVTKEGYVLAGNGRTMALVRALKERPELAKQLSDSVREAREKFGIGAAKPKEPTVIVRRLTEELEPEQMRAATKDLNEDPQKEVDPTDMAVARAHNLTPATIQFIADRLTDQEGTLRDLLTSDTSFLKELMRRFSDERITHSGELPRFLDPASGKLNEQGLKMVEETVLGRVVKSPEMLRNAEPSERNLFMGALTEAIRAEALPDDWHIGRDLVNGLRLRQEARRAGKTIDMMLEPQLLSNSFLEAVRTNRLAVSLAHWIDRNAAKPLSLRSALKAYLQEYRYAEGAQGTLGGLIETKKPHEAFNQHFGATLTPEEFAAGDEKGMYLYSGIPFDKALGALGSKLSARGKAFLEWALVPESAKPIKPNETYSEYLKRLATKNTFDSMRERIAGLMQSILRASIQHYDTHRFPYFHEQVDQYGVDQRNVAGRVIESVSKWLEPIIFESEGKQRKPREQRRLLEHLQEIINFSNLAVRAEDKLRPVTSTDLLTGRSVKLRDGTTWRVTKHTQRQAAGVGNAEFKYEAVDLEGNGRTMRGVPVQKILYVVEEGLLTPAHVWEEFGKTQQEIARSLRAYADERIREAPEPVLEARRRGIELMQRYRRILEERGRLSPHQDRFGEDYWPQVYDEPFAFHPESILIPPRPGRVKEAGRVYTKRAKGSLRQHSPDVIAAGMRHLINVEMDNLLDDFAHKVGSAWDLTDRMVEQAKRDQRDPANLVVHGILVDGVEYVPYSPARGTRRWIQAPESRFEYAIDAALSSDPDLSGQILTLRQLLDWTQRTGRRAYLIPRPIVSALAQFGKSRSEMARLMGYVAQAARSWKWYVLTSLGVPFRVMNTVGDFIAAAAFTPGWDKVTLGRLPRIPVPAGIAAYKMLPRAVRDVVDQLKREPDRLMARLSQELGVTEQSYSVAEIRGIRRHPDLNRLLEPNRGRAMRVASLLIKGFDQILDGTALVNQTAESIPRQMLWLYYMSKRIPAKRAERIVARQLVDYRNIDAITRFSRTFLVEPFMTYFRQMIPTFLRAFTGRQLGTPSERPGGGGIAPPNRPPTAGTGLLGEEGPPPSGIPEIDRLRYAGEQVRGGFYHAMLLLGLPMIANWYWNSVLNRDLDDRIDNWTKYYYGYTIVPWLRTDDGRPAVVTYGTPWDLLAFAGLGNPLERVERLARAEEEGAGSEARALQAYELAGGGFRRMVAGGFGPTVGIPAKMIEQSDRDFREFRREHPKIDRILESDWQQFTSDYLVQLRYIRPFERRDLDGLPTWVPYMMTDSPFGFLRLKVPYSEAEIRRLRMVRSGGVPHIGNVTGPIARAIGAGR